MIILPYSFVKVFVCDVMRLYFEIMVERERANIVRYLHMEMHSWEPLCTAPRRAQSTEQVYACELWQYHQAKSCPNQWTHIHTRTVHFHTSIHELTQSTLRSQKIHFVLSHTHTQAIYSSTEDISIPLNTRVFWSKSCVTNNKIWKFGIL